VRPPIGAFHVMDFLKVREIIDLCAPIKEDIKRKLARMIEHPELRVIEDRRRKGQLDVTPDSDAMLRAVGTR
jgi:hypothetical protein